MSCNLCFEEVLDASQLRAIHTCTHKLCSDCSEVADTQCPICIENMNANSKSNFALLDYLNTRPGLKQSVKEYLNDSDVVSDEFKHSQLKFTNKRYLAETESKMNYLSKSIDNNSADEAAQTGDSSSSESNNLTYLASSNESNLPVIQSQTKHLNENVVLRGGGGSSGQNTQTETIRMRHHQNAYSQVSTQFNSVINVDNNSDCILVTDLKSVESATNWKQFSFIKQSSGEKSTKQKRKLSRKASSFIIFLLFVINLINYIDRLTLAGILNHVQDYFKIDNSESGLIQTIFICGYMLLAPLFGYLGDRYERKWIIIFGVGFWSLTTLLGAFVPNDKFWLFLVLRALVGVGEASYSCIAPTIIGDMFTGSVRTTSLAIFYLAIPLGSGLGYMIAPKVTAISGDWRWSLCVTPAIGFLCVFLLAVFVKEPKRGGAEGFNSHECNESKSSVLSDTMYLLKNKTFVWITIGFTFASYVVGGVSWWVPMYVTFAQNANTQDSSDISFYFGVVTFISGLVGVSISSLLAPKLRVLKAYADPLICAIGSLIAVPCLFIVIMETRTLSSVLFWFLTSIAITAICLSWTMVADMLLYVIHPDKRSIASALNILITHLLGDACSPYVIGKISDYIRAGKPDTFTSRFLSLQTAMYSGPIFSALSFAAYLFAAIYVEADKKKVDQYVKKMSQLHGIVMTEKSTTATKRFQKSDSGIGSLNMRSEEENDISDIYINNKNEQYLNPLLDDKKNSNTSSNVIGIVNEIDEENETPSLKHKHESTKL